MGMYSMNRFDQFSRYGNFRQPQQWNDYRGRSPMQQGTGPMQTSTLPAQSVSHSGSAFSTTQMPSTQGTDPAEAAFASGLQGAANASPNNPNGASANYGNAYTAAAQMYTNLANSTCNPTLAAAYKSAANDFSSAASSIENYPSGNHWGACGEFGTDLAGAYQSLAGAASITGNCSAQSAYSSAASSYGQYATDCSQMNQQAADSDYAAANASVTVGTNGSGMNDVAAGTHALSNVWSTAAATA